MLFLENSVSLHEFLTFSGRQINQNRSPFFSTHCIV